MKLRIDDIPSSGLDLKLVLNKDWLKNVSEDDCELECMFVAPISLDLRVTKSERDIFVHGHVTTNLVMNCSRCLKDFDCSRTSDFKYIFSPAEDNCVPDDLELSREDLEFSFYRGEEIDISHVVLEQIILTIPLQPLCHHSCRGLCYRCGKDLNKETCKCSEKEISNIRFAKLQDFKVESGKQDMLKE